MLLRTCSRSAKQAWRDAHWEEESQKYHEMRELSHTLPLGGKLRFEMTDAGRNSLRCTMFRSSLFKNRDSIFCVVYLFLAVSLLWLVFFLDQSQALVLSSGVGRVAASECDLTTS